MKTISILLAIFGAFSYAGTKVAVTIDDLPSAATLPTGVTWKQVAAKMLGILKDHKVPEVYGFINAGKVKQDNDGFQVLELWKAAGYPLGNHAYQHEDIDKVTLEEFKAAIDKNEPMLKKLSDVENWKYFRYPYLHEGATMERRNGIRDYLKERGYTIAQVTIDFEDWAWNAPYTRCKEKGDTKAIERLKHSYLKNAGDILERSEQLSLALFKKDISHILLLHIGGFDAEMLDQLLTLYESKGVEFIPLSQAVRDDIYAFDPGIPAKWGSEFTYQVLKARKLTLKDVGMSPYTGFPENELGEICLEK